MTAAAGSLNSSTMRAAASRSSRFVYEAPCPAARCASPRPSRRLLGVPRRLLVRVLAVAQVAHLAQRRRVQRRPASRLRRAAREAVGRPTVIVGERRRRSPCRSSPVCANALRASSKRNSRRRPAGAIELLEHASDSRPARRRRARPGSSWPRRAPGSGRRCRSPRSSASNGVSGLAAALTNG